MAKTKQPTGLAVSRSGNKFNFTWKRADSNYSGGQWLESRDYDGSANSKVFRGGKIGVSATSATHSLTLNKYYPHTNKYLRQVAFRVKGKRSGYYASNWTAKVWEPAYPNTPSISVNRDDDLSNVCKFSVSTVVSTTDTKIYVDTEWQSVLVENCKETDGSKITWNKDCLGWLTSTFTAASWSRTITEDTAILAKGSCTRWLRARARGPKGHSPWRYAKFVYANSLQANIKGVSVLDKGSAGYLCTVNWEAPTNAANPIDETVVEYAIAKPDRNLTCPSSASWYEANISKDTSAEDAATFAVGSALSEDECLFVRVNTIYDNKTTYGESTIASVGTLSDPSGLSVTTDSTSHKATITATNNSSVVDSVLVVECVQSNGKSFAIGIIPHGSTSVTVQAPDWGTRQIAFCVYAMVGSYERQTRSDGVYSYKLNEKMRSASTLTKGGSVPLPPSGVEASKTDKDGTIRVAWDWSWEDATEAEISWADHEDAWESTEEPQVYTVPNRHSSYWNISGLETGRKWYIRVRLCSETEDSVKTYGPWSEIATVDLVSAPAIPVLQVSDSIIPEDGTVTASWVYSSTDSTKQGYAEIAALSNGSYDNIVAHALTAQHVTISAKEAGFTRGNVYSLALRVKSESGMLSEWSEPVAVTIAEPIVCTIENTSLVEETIELNPEQAKDAIVTALSPEGKERAISDLKVDITPTQAGSGDPSPENVRPITGWTETKVFDTGKNLADESAAIGYNASVAVDDGYISVTKNASSNYPAAHIDTYLRAGVTYTVSATCVQVTTQARLSIRDIAPSNTTVTNSAAYTADGQRKSVTYTPTKSGMYRVALFSSFGADDSSTAIFTDIQCEIGSVATAYEPYTGTTTTTALGQTVYGGAVDIVTGTLTLTHKAETFDGTEAWGREASGNFYVNLNNASKMVGRRSGGLGSEMLCNWLKPTNTGTDNIVWVGSSGSYLNAKCSSASDATAFKAMLTATPLVVVYPLETPQTYNLTAQEVELLTGQNHVWADTGDIDVRTADFVNRIESLKVLPLMVETSGAGEGGVTSLIVERAESYHMERPDERDFDGYDKETIAVLNQSGDGTFVVDSSNLIGSFDDGAKYRLIASVKDGLGQISEDTKEFEVHWEHQAKRPSATVQYDAERLIAKITPIAPTGADASDTCDIYRLSVDKPELVVQGATFGQTYVDPYPALGSLGGYRVVTVTSNGDYTTEDNEIAWIDSKDIDGVGYLDNEKSLNVIDFDGDQIQFYYDSDLSNTWNKDFQETHYLGGSVVGDWNIAVSRTGTLTTLVISDLDKEMIQSIRRLAVYPDICHVRTSDGSSYSANIDISEDKSHSDRDMLLSYSLSITRVDTEGYDGMTLEQWNSENPEEV